MYVLFTDYKQPDLNLEYQLMARAGLEMAAAQCHTPEEVIRAGKDAAVLVANGAPITRAVFEALPQLEMVSSVGIGVDHIDVEAARDHGVWVANVPDANVNEVATHAFAMALSLIRHLAVYDRGVREGKWDKRMTGPLKRPAAMTLGILGLGHIGRALAPLAQPCFQQILAHDPYCSPDTWPEGVGSVDPGDLFAQSDVVSIHVPLTNQTRELVDGSLLSRMRGGYLVNTSRGPIISEPALLEALDNGCVAGAALDVLAQEPPSPDNPLLHHPKVQLSPHAAFYSLEAEDALRRGAVDNVIQWAKEGVVSRPVVRGAARSESSAV